MKQFWNAFAAIFRVGPTSFRVFQFGDSAELADELSSQVVAGKKRATTTLLRDFATRGMPVPKPGNFGVVIDGKNAPCSIIRMVQVEIKPMRDVDERFAWDEGGGDRSLAWWRAAYARYFKRQGAREGFEVDDGVEVVLERFEVVWPPEIDNGHPAAG
ncbi:MAG: ASCH domain-containing protein [Candidatus Eremiobacteraeota bacterium]|nr:ASCH domain-containing protein [Candidatus Eremiobacteraeota bacterium]